MFGSGRGSNCEAILNAIEGNSLPHAAVRVVVSNNSDAGILAIARQRGIGAVHLSERHFDGERAFVDAMLGTLVMYDVHLIVLAGYMKKMPARVIAAYRDRIINVHPALLPKFGGRGMYGMHVHEAVLAAGERYSGATVHIVDEEYDRGRILLQKRVEVAPDETPDSLAAKVLRVEHEILPEAIRQFTGVAAGRKNVVAS